jgi:hypothetical protein
VNDVQVFLGFADFYRTFIEGYSGIAALLTDLTRKGDFHTFEWSDAAGDAFTQLIAKFMEDPILAYFEPGLETVIETDASGDVYGCVVQ